MCCLGWIDLAVQLASLSERNTRIDKTMLSARRVFNVLCVWAAALLTATWSAADLESSDITISIADETIEEHDRRSSEVKIAISAVQDEDVILQLVASGVAKLGADFDLEPESVTIKAGETEALSTLTPIRDWVVEGDENIELEAQTKNASDERIASAKAQILLQDDDENAEEVVAESGFDLYAVPPSLDGEEDALDISVRVFNLGSQTSQSAQLLFRIFEFISIGSGRQVRSLRTSVPPLNPYGDGGSPYTFSHRVDLEDLRAGNTFIGRVDLTVPGESEELNSRNNITVFGFSLDEDGDLLVRCIAPDRPESNEGTDPLLEHQWHIQNDGQNSFSQTYGVVNADLRMRKTIEQGHTGKGVRVAVVDTGLEICHPDLSANVEAGASVNFFADPEGQNHWPGTLEHDPFNPESTGDHGTMVAGTIGATANNSQGGRGVAPGALLRGYNYLQYASFDNLLTSFGGSNASSNNVDVVNMSYGALLASSFHPVTYDLFAWGTRSLRQQRGSLFVKAAGNRFFGCTGLYHEIHDEIGCVNAISDYTNNLPFVIVVGAFNSQDERASYSSVGSNIWVTAPAGQDGTVSAAVVTTDQIDRQRGFGTVYRDQLIRNRYVDLNPDGDYMSTFNGTSAASAAVSGVVALLLEVEPNLTWRDVKHILAFTARPIQPEQPRVRIAIADTPYVMQYGWVTNAAGYAFHNWFGFGAVHVDNAVALAEDYSNWKLGEFAVADWIERSEKLNIPDNDGLGVTDAMEVTRPLPVIACDVVNEASGQPYRHCLRNPRSVSAGQGPGGARISIEAVQLRIRADHHRLSDVGFTLISPQGTESVVNSVLNNSNIRNVNEDEEFHWLSNAFYGESPVGEWKLKAVDVQPEKVGTINSWSLKFFTGSHPQQKSD